MANGNKTFSLQDGVTLKEFFLEKLHFLAEILDTKIKHLEEVMRQNDEASAAALRLQTTEMERRLENLNNEAGRIQQVLAQSVPREVHTQDIKEIRGLIEKQALDSKDFVTKEYLTSILKPPSEKIEGLVSYKDIASGKASQNSVNIAYIFAAISVGLSLLGLFLRN